MFLRAFTIVVRHIKIEKAYYLKMYLILDIIDDVIFTMKDTDTTSIDIVKRGWIYD